jgi:hypothetical protein
VVDRQLIRIGPCCNCREYKDDRQEQLIVF